MTYGINLESALKMANVITPDPAELAIIYAQAVGDDGLVKMLPAQFWLDFKQESVSAFCVAQGLYVIPTLELYAYLYNFVNQFTTIEIGAGNGVMADALGIIATDSFQQADPAFQQMYSAFGQQPVKYGPNVRRMNAYDAIRKYKPHTVIGQFCTHKYRQSRHSSGGNMEGIDEHGLMERVKRYIHIGNTSVHDKKLIYQDRNLYNFQEYRPTWLVTRGINREKNVIWIFENK